jgi:hypothetical protein
VLQDAKAEFDVSIRQLRRVIPGFFGSAEYFDRTGPSEIAITSCDDFED